jgi:peptidoglycan/xylan/chitin deacetylase (PgdA/CDA1 family)
MPMSFRVPRELFKCPCSGRQSVTLEWDGSESLVTPELLTDPEKAAMVADLRSKRMFTLIPPLSSKMPFSYQMVPAAIRSIVARTIGRRMRTHVDGWAHFPSFPLDLSADALSDILSIEYEKNLPTPVLLTHDIDSPEGLKNLPFFLAEEESVGARSTNFVVPCRWKINHSLLSDIMRRGHEIGIHGFDHSNRTAFMNSSSIQERIEKMGDFISRYRVKGYRAPSLLRTPSLLQALAKSFKYDSSIPTSGGLFPVPNNGCASARIFEVEGIWEIPLSMPRDGTLLFLGLSPEQILELWIKCAEQISRSGGVIVLLTHCEKRFSGNNEMLRAYRGLLRYFKNSQRFTFKTCAEITTLRDQKDAR